MLQFDIDVTAADQATRTIEGIAVPYGETANLGGTTYSFERGSLKPARARTPLLLGHDRNRPVGVMTELADTETGAIARFRIDQGAEGDLALEQAASGSRGGLSIGAEIVAAADNGDGTVSVTDASLLEVSLVSIPAFAGASLTSVSADADDDDLTTPDDDPDPDPTPTMQPASDPQETTVEQTSEPIAAETTTIPTITAEKREPMLADTYIVNMVKAMKGDQTATRLIEAELNVLDTNQVVGLVPDQYLRQIIDGLPENRPLANNVRTAALPAEGMKLYKPIWNTTPTGGWIAQDDPTPSNAVAVGNHEVNIEQWAYGVSMTVAALERGFGVAESVYRQIVLNYYSDVEAKLAAQLQNGGGVSPGATTLATIGKLSAAVYSDSGRRPDKVYMAPDVWADLLATEGSLPFTSGSTTASSLAGQIAGLDIVVSSHLSGGALIVADSSVVELRESSPLQLRANVIGTMQVELGVTSFASFDTEVATAVKIAD
ncbi:MAG: HK97 family phage prohead protease [Gaiellales bacterium]